MAIPVMQNDIIEIRMKGLVEGQDVLNIYHVDADDGAGGPPPAGLTLLDVLEGWKTFWRTHVLPLLTNVYFIQVYEAAKVVEVNAVPVPGQPDRYNLQYVGPVEIIGDFNDQGQLIADSMTSMTAIGLRKRATRNLSNLRGGMRIGPRPESATESVTGNPNRWTQVAVTEHQTLASEFEQPQTINSPVGAFDTYLGILSRSLASVTPLVPSNGYARVDSVVANPYVTSQVSRKQRA